MESETLDRLEQSAIKDAERNEWVVYIPSDILEVCAAARENAALRANLRDAERDCDIRDAQLSGLKAELEAVRKVYEVVLNLWESGNLQTTNEGAEELDYALQNVSFLGTSADTVGEGSV